MARAGSLGVVAAALLWLSPGCGASDPPAAGPGALPSVLLELEAPWTGDLDGMRARRVVRILTVYAKGLYFLDGADQRGVTYEFIKLFEKQLNRHVARGDLRTRVLIIPVTRDRLLPALVEGYGDIAASNLTITPARLAQVDFAAPLLTGVDEIVVTGPNAPPLESLQDLAGRELLVPRATSYWEHLVALNETLRSEGREEIRLRAAPRHLEDADLLEMVAAGLLPMVVVDSTMAEFWSRVFDTITPRPDLVVHTGSEIAWALRKESPELRELLDAFAATHRRGSLLGNVVLNRFLRSTEWVRNSQAAVDMERFQTLAELFRKYAGDYEFDWLLVAAQAYQESRLDQSARSAAGAVGVMQLLPSTAADPNVGIHGIEELENNVHAGVKYLAFLRDRYFSDPGISELDRTLLSFAAYNAGPRRVARLRDEAAKAGFDPNAWFGNVEVIAARRVGREPVQYVSNIYKYYVAYQLIRERRALARGET